jgi:hypothetical protein
MYIALRHPFSPMDVQLTTMDTTSLFSAFPGRDRKGMEISKEREREREHPGRK